MKKPLYHYDEFSPHGYLYIKTGVATEDQLKKSLDKAILHFKMPCDYKINMVKIFDKISAQEFYSGYSYVWLSNKIVVYALTNRNLDGSERGDSKEPILFLPGFKYDKEQIFHLEKVRIDEAPVPKYGYFEVERAKVKENSDHMVTSILIAHGLPNWVTEEFLKQEFGRYVSTKTLVKNPVTGKMELYPLVKINGGSVTLTFQPDTNDGKFALMMSLRTKFTNPNDPDDYRFVYFRYLDQTTRRR